MIDLRELQKKGVVRIPKKEIKIPTNSQGFVDLRNPNKTQKESTKSNADFFGFMNNSTSTQETEFSTETNGYNKREVDQKTTELDNKIYKLEQRIELLEKKLDINQNNNGALIGW
jgi:hypothetical protein